MIYHYSVFGFYIQSEIPLVAFRTVEPALRPQVIVRAGIVHPPAADLPDTVYRKYLIYNPRLCYQRLPAGTGDFIIHKREYTTEVILDFKDPSEKQTLLAYFYGTGLSAILNLNDQFALHASGVLVAGKLVLFCGPSGIGKSTLAAHLKSVGYPLYTDDKCVLFKQGEDQSWNAYPSLQIMRLWDDAVDDLPTEKFLVDPVPVVTRQRKQQYRIQEAELVAVAVPLAGIFVLSSASSATSPNCQTLQGVEKLRILQSQIFRRFMIKGFQKEPVLWDFVSQLARDVPIVRVERPQPMSAHSFGLYMKNVIGKFGR